MKFLLLCFAILALVFFQCVAGSAACVGGCCAAATPAAVILPDLAPASGGASACQAVFLGSDRCITLHHSAPLCTLLNRLREAKPVRRVLKAVFYRCRRC